MQMDRKLVIRFAVRETVGIISMAIALFWSAGEIAWWPAWGLLIVTSAWILATGTVILRHSPDLLAERLGPRQGAKRWDTALMSGHGMLQLGVLVVAGLDHRYQWSTGFQAAIQVIALIACGLGYGLVVWATATNAFFSQIVRIQTERGHKVVTDGPYAYVRHPAYSGGLLTQVSIPILLASWWGLLIGIADAALMILRTVLEDRTLHAELPGYSEYARRVRHRLVPRIW
jgi:protein-S-isoprenylcysteine O-methyltransferase Ste14